jgi:hypothetical protein
MKIEINNNDLKLINALIDISLKGAGISALQVVNELSSSINNSIKKLEASQQNAADGEKENSD